MILDFYNYSKIYGDKQLYVNSKNVTYGCYKAIKILCFGVAFCHKRDKQGKWVIENGEPVREKKIGIMWVR